MDYLNGTVVSNKSHPARKVIHTGDQTKVVQSAKADSDINVIVSRMVRNGGMTISARVPTAGDFSEQVTDYHTAMNMLRTANDEFMKLSPKIRSKFANDPQRLMDYLADPKNDEESYELGLRTRKPAPEPVLVTVSNPSNPPAPAAGPAA